MLPIPPPLIASERVYLRGTTAADLPALLALNADTEVTRFLGFAPWQTMADAERWFARISEQQASGSALEFVLLDRATEGVIGRCSLFEFESAHGLAGLGYGLLPAYWRRGYMREALTALIDCAFRDFQVRRLEATVEAPNLASAGLLRRLGFTREGLLRQRWISHGTPVDTEVFGLLQEEWGAVPRRRESAAAGRLWPQLLRTATRCFASRT